MKLYGKEIRFSKIVFLTLYYGLLRYLPCSTNFLLGNASKKLRYLCCKKIFYYCGRNVNIERKAYFGSGLEVEIGDNSGLGMNCCVPSDIVIGKNVMMGPNCYILNRNHQFNSVDIPMIQQGFSKKKRTIIEDDVWIGRDVLFTPGRLVKKGTIIAGGCVLCKDFPPYSIIGGNPSKFIRSRLCK